MAQLPLHHPQVGRLGGDRRQVVELAGNLHAAVHEPGSLLQVSAHLRRHTQDMQRIGTAEPVIRSLDTVEGVLAQASCTIQVLIAERHPGHSTQGNRFAALVAKALRGVQAPVQERPSRVVVALPERQQRILVKSPRQRGVVRIDGRASPIEPIPPLRDAAGQRPESHHAH